MTKNELIKMLRKVPGDKLIDLAGSGMMPFDPGVSNISHAILFVDESGEVSGARLIPQGEKKKPTPVPTAGAQTALT